MSTIGNKYRVDSSRFPPFVQKEHIIDACRADRHHPSEAKARQGPRPKQGAEGRRLARGDAAGDRDEDGNKGNWAAAIVIREGRENEGRHAAEDDSGGRAVRGGFRVDAEGLAEEDEAGIDEGSVEGTQEGHESHLDQDRPL